MAGGCRALVAAVAVAAVAQPSLAAGAATRRPPVVTPLGPIAALSRLSSVPPREIPRGVPVVSSLRLLRSEVEGYSLYAYVMGDSQRARTAMTRLPSAKVPRAGSVCLVVSGLATTCGGETGLPGVLWVKAGVVVAGVVSDDVVRVTITRDGNTLSPPVINNSFLAEFPISAKRAAVRWQMTAGYADGKSQSIRFRLG